MGPHWERDAARVSAQDSIAYATALTATGDTAGAEAVLRKAVIVTPDSAELYDALGTVLAKREVMEEASSEFRRAIGLDPSLTQAQYHLGVALLAMNEPAEAIGPLQLAAAAEPRNLERQLQLGRALSSLHEDAKALAALHQAAELRTPTTNPDALYALAIALQASGDAKGALPLFEAAISADKANGKASSSELTNYALAKVQTGDAKGALPLYAEALAIGPDSATLREDYGVGLPATIGPERCHEAVPDGVNAGAEQCALHYDLGLALKLKDNLAAAVPEFEQAAKLDETLPDPAYTLGVIYMQQARFSDAATQLRHATALRPENGDAWALLGSVLKDSGDTAGATDALKRAIALEPDQPSLHIQLAALEMEAGEKEAAATDRKIAAELTRAAANRQRLGLP